MKIKKIFSFLLVFVLLVCCLSGCKNNKNPDIDVLPENPIDKEAEVQYETFEKIEFFYLKGLSIPKDWYYEERQNGFSVIENKTGTEINFIIEDYNPRLNSMNQNIAKEVLTTDTKAFISFKKETGNLLFYKYKQLINGKEYVVCEKQKFNFKYAYTLRLICEEKFFEEYNPVFEKMVSSLVLSTDIKTIPTNYDGIYNQSLRVLTMYPRDWQTSTGGDFYTTKKANSNITVTFASPIANFNGMDKTTYNGVMQKTVSNFSTSSFSNINGVVKAEGYYTENSIRYIACNTIYNMQNFSINIIYVAPESEYATYLTAYNTMVNEIYIQ